MKPIILTGLRANGEFHLGNYLGAIQPILKLQQTYGDQYQINMFVPDLHSFTTPINHSQLYRQTLDNLRLYVAAGLNIASPDTYIYRQSYIPAHSELTWILDCFTGFGELSRMTQFKDKSQGQAMVSVGLFNYPALMAADILLYGATYVPVGDDQKQHLELARDLAIRLNNKFDKELFTVPLEWSKQMEFTGLDNGVRIRSLRSPDKKMSKSVQDPAGTILLSDNPDEAAKKILSATTDSLGSIELDWKQQPGISNLMQISALLEQRPLTEIATEWRGKSSYGELKQYTAKLVSNFLTELQANYGAINENIVLTKLQHDEAHVNIAAQQTLYRVQQAVGLRPSEKQV